MLAIQTGSSPKLHVPRHRDLTRSCSAASTLNLWVTSEKGSDPNSAKHPSGRSGYWGLTPFRDKQSDGNRN